MTLVSKGLVVLSVGLAASLVGCSAKHRPRDKELQAIQLLGSANVVSANIKLDAECLNSTEEEKATIRQRLVTWLGSDDPTQIDRPRIADGFHDAATMLSKVARNCKKLQLTVVTTGHAEITRIREILGNEDSVGQFKVNLGDDTIQPKVHKYGWIEFVTINEEVAMLVLDFTSSGL